ncbi:MAG: magnesium/cobalt transporter CorA [Deltaproteobacteria bacterium]
MARKRRRKRAQLPGTPAGTLTAHAEAAAGPVAITLFVYDEAGFEERTLRPEEIPGLAVPERGVLWLDVSGLSDPSIVQAVGDRFHFHPLALEDVLNIPQRPKVERYGDHLLVVLREIQYPEEPEQFTLFLADRVVVTFQEKPGDPFAPVRERIRKGAGRIRSLGADYLAYSLCDAVLDAYFPSLERIGDQVEELEERVMEDPGTEVMRRIREVRRKLIEVRRAAWPARDAMNDLIRGESGLILPETKVFLRDCTDHAIQLMDMVESYRETVAALADEYLSAMSHRMNEIMKVLTIIATIFIPLSFIAGVYGMNFDPQSSPYNMPELAWRYGYPFALLLMAAVAGGLLFWFRKRKWL